MKSNVCLSLAAVIASSAVAAPVRPQVVKPSAPLRELLADSRRALDADGALEFDPFTVLVRFAPGTPDEIKVFARAFAGGTYVRSFQSVAGLEQLRVSGRVFDAVEALSMIPGVEFAEPDYVVRIADTGAVPPPGGHGVVADLDTGIDLARADLAARAWTNPGETAANGVDDDGNGYVDDVHGYDFYNHDAEPWDDNGHGTRSAAGVIGAAGAEVMALKVLNAAGRGQVSDAIAALDYAVAMGSTAWTGSWVGGTASAAFKAALEGARERGDGLAAAPGDAPGGAPPGVNGGGGVALLVRAGSRDRGGRSDGRELAGAGADRAGSAQRPGSASGSYTWVGSGSADGRGERGVWTGNGSAQDLDISLGVVDDPVERFIPTIATWRYVQAAIDRFGEGRGVQVAGTGPHDGKVADGNNSVWFGVDFIADRTDKQQFIGGEVSPSAGCLAYIDPSPFDAGSADLCFAVIVGDRYTVCRLPGVVRAGVRVSFQACCRLGFGDWQLNPFHGAPSVGDPARAILTSKAPVGSTMQALTSSTIVAMHHAGVVPLAMATAPDLLRSGIQTSFLQHGSFTGKLFAFEYHPTTFVPTVADQPQTTRAKVSLTFRGVAQDPVVTNRGTARELPGTTLVGPPSNRLSTGVWLPPNRQALAGDLAAIGAWVRRLGAGERCVAIVLGDSNSGAAEGGMVDAVIQSVMTFYGGEGYDARPDVYWSATMNDNHSLRQYGGLGGRSPYGGDVSADPNDIPLVSGSGGSVVYPFPATRGPFDEYEWAAYAASGMHVQKPGINSLGMLSAFCTSDTSDTGVWRLPNLYGVENTADGVMNDPRSGHARLAGESSGLLYARSRLKAGDLVCLEAVLGQRTTNPGGSLQFAVRAQNGADAVLPNGGRLVSAASGVSGTGWLTVDAGANGVDAEREALAAAYTGYAGQPLRPATMNDWSIPTTPLSGIGLRNTTRVRTQPLLLGEIDVPGEGISIAPEPVAYQPYVLLKRRTICTMFGVRIVGNLNPGQDHERLPWTVAMMGVGGSNSTDQMAWIFSQASARVLREQYWLNVLSSLNARGAHVLFVHVESQNSRQATGVPQDGLSETSRTWCGYTGAKIRALHTLAERSGAASVCTLAINSPRLTTDNTLPRGEALRGLAPLLDRCAAIDLFQVIGQRETQDALWALYPVLNGDYDMAHPHYTLLGTAAIGSAFAAGLEADAAGGR